MKQRLGVFAMPLQEVVINPKEMGSILDIMEMKTISVRVGSGFVYYMGLSPMFEEVIPDPKTPIPTYDIMMRIDNDGNMEVKAQHTAKAVTDNIVSLLQTNISKEM